MHVSTEQLTVRGSQDSKMRPFKFLPPRVHPLCNSFALCAEAVNTIAYHS